MKNAETSKENQILQLLQTKSQMKQQVFDNTYKTFQNLKQTLQLIADAYNTKMTNVDRRVQLFFKDQSTFQCEMKMAGDMLVFHMHSNVFEFDREHGVWKISYVQKDKLASYCGVINIYNFLADSFKYNRSGDVGYLIARIFINKDYHYFVEGKRQMGYLFNDFGNATLTNEALRDILETAMLYALDFDLLVPPYDAVKMLSVDQINENRRHSPHQTGKRLGFSFNADDVQGKTEDSNFGG